MKLAPYWWHTLGPDDDLESPPQPLPGEADCVVVGAGYAGLTAALALLRAGKSVAVLDRGQPGHGAATRNGGINSGSIRPDHEALADRYGASMADRLHAERIEAREDLGRFIRDEKIDCAYHRPGWFQGAMSEKHFDDMARQAEAVDATYGSEEGSRVRLVPRGEQHAIIDTDRFHGGLLHEGTGAFHPARFYAGLLRAFRGEGGVVCPDTEVRRIDGRGPAKRVETDKGPIAAGRVLATTNAYTGRGLEFTRFLRQRLVPVRSAIIVTGELGEGRVRELLPELSSFSTSAHLSAYSRPTPDGRRILIGSRSFDRTEPGRRTVAMLRRKLADIFPGLADCAVDYAWLGNVAFTRPQIPVLFEHEDVVHVGGYAGSGTVWARWLGRKAAEKVLGSANKPSVFEAPAPEAIPFYDGEPWFMPAINGWFSLLDRVNEGFRQKR